MADPTEGPTDYEEGKPLEAPLYAVLAILEKPGSVLFTVKPGDAGALMTKSGHCQKVPSPWIKQLVRRALIDQPIGRSNKVACMGWFQYELTYEGQQVLNRWR